MDYEKVGKALEKMRQIRQDTPAERNPITGLTFREDSGKIFMWSTLSTAPTSFNCLEEWADHILQM